tara:strand:- start:447 stop:608 length:162 start_codon:yes stop_codon:yes gene_type:complete
MQLSISYKREIEINARIRELSSRILTQESKIINATESIATLKAEQEKLKRELK